MLNLADGQLAATSGTLLGVNTDSRRVSVLLRNTSASLTETVVLTVSVNGGTARSLVRAVLAPQESLHVRNLPLNPADVLAGSTTDASTVDYLVATANDGPFEVVSLDVNGALKQVNSGITGNQTVGGNQTVTGNETVTGNLAVTGTSTLTGNTTAAGTLAVTGTSAFTGATTTTGLATLTGGATLGGPLTEAIGASTAAAGTTTTDAGVLPAGTANVYPTTAADDTTGVRIHASDKVTGRVLLIGNGVSNKVLKVYAPSGGTINGAAADAAFSSASGKGVLIVCLSSVSNTWLAS